MNTLRKYWQSLRLEPHAPGFGRQGLGWLFALALLGITAYSWIESGSHVQQQVSQAADTAHDDADHDAHDIALGLQRNLSLLHGIPFTFSRTQQLIDALQDRRPLAQRSGLPALNHFLERAITDLNAVSVLWVMDLQGNCIAASNAGKDESFVGSSFADRDYFKMSLRGQSGKQFAVGKKTGIPGMYFSAPVLQNDKVVGVVATKVDLPFLGLWLSQANAFVTDPYDVVILATDARLLMNTWSQTGAPQLTEAQALQRYQMTSIPALRMQAMDHPGGTELLQVDRLPVPVTHSTQALAEDDLVVHVLGLVPSMASRDRDRMKRFGLEVCFGLLVLLLVSTAVFYVRNIQRARAALLKHKARMDEAQLLAQVGSWELDLASGSMLWSDQVRRIFRLQPSPAATNLAAFLEHIAATDRPAVLNILKDLPGAPERVECSVGIVRMDGDTGRAHLQLQPVKNHSGVLESCRGTLRDTTAQELLEGELRRAKIDAEWASRMKSDFLANVSHELKTPMNAILGMSYLALQGDLSPPQKTQIQTVHRSAEGLLHIINEILDFSQIEAGKYATERREFLLREVTRSLTDYIEPLAEAKGLEFQLDLPPTLPGRLMGDPAQLGKILQALASNSVKFTLEGRVSVGIELVSQTATGVELHFWVNDTGVGMSPEQQNRLFQAFSQVDGSRTRKFGGTGLGLVISKRLLDLMGGTIWVQSALGTGTTMHFSVPFETVAEPQPATPRTVPGALAPMAGATDPGTGLHILVVEDNPVNQELAVLVLKKFHIAVTLAAHGQQALDILAARHDFDAILMDCHMPVMDGYTAARAIHENAAWQHIPVIALTANVSANDRKKIFESGMCDVVAKPYKAQDLIDTLMRWINPENPTQPQPLSEDTQASSTDSLPHLPGIDVQAGLAIAMADAHLYKKLLKLYVQSEADFADRFHAAWHSGDSELAVRLAHSLKGVSGSIGAKGVQAAAQALERACKQSLAEDAIRPPLEQTLATLQQVLTSLAGLDTVAAENITTVLDHAKVAELVSRLTALLLEHNLSAYDLAEELLAATTGTALSPLVKKVVRAIDRFDLDAALEELEKLEPTLEAQ